MSISRKIVYRFVNNYTDLTKKNGVVSDKKKPETSLFQAFLFY